MSTTQPPTLVGRTLDDVLSDILHQAPGHGWAVRVTNRDGQPQVVTRDWRPDDRINVHVVEGVITAQFVG